MTYYHSERKNVPAECCELEDISVDPGTIIPMVKDWSKRTCTLTKCFPKYMERLLNFEVRNDDLWVVTMPKCGTTWMQETAWLVNNNFDFETANKIKLYDRSVFLEIKALYDVKRKFNSFDEADKLKSPRLIKTHLPASFLPTQIWKKKVKIIYVARNVNDAAVSYSHFQDALGDFKGTKKQFMEAFMSDNVHYTPFWPHVLEFWQMRNESHIFFTSYEKMNANLKEVIKSLCIFLNKAIPSESVLERAVKHLSFDQMKNSVTGKSIQEHIDQVLLEKNPQSDFKFMRKGVVGSFKDELSEDIILKLNDWSNTYLMEFGITNDELLLGH